MAPRGTQCAENRTRDLEPVNRSNVARKMRQNYTLDRSRQRLCVGSLNLINCNVVRRLGQLGRSVAGILRGRMVLGRHADIGGCLAVCSALY